MKALTLTQPWASLVALGHKQIETRSWQTKYRGPIAIHAAKGYPRDAQFESLTEPFWSCLPHGIELPRGEVLAVAFLTSIGSTDDACPDLSAQELAFGNYESGRYAWYFVRIQQIPPVAAKGALGLWDWHPPIYLFGGTPEEGMGELCFFCGYYSVKLHRCYVCGREDIREPSDKYI